MQSLNSVFICFNLKTIINFLLIIFLCDAKDLPVKPKYLVTFTVGYAQKKNIDAAVKKVGCGFFYGLSYLK